VGTGRERDRLQQRPIRLLDGCRHDTSLSPQVAAAASRGPHSRMSAYAGPGNSPRCGAFSRPTGDFCPQLVYIRIEIAFSLPIFQKNWKKNEAYMKKNPCNWRARFIAFIKTRNVLRFSISSPNNAQGLSPLRFFRAKASLLAHAPHSPRRLGYRNQFLDLYFVQILTRVLSHGRG